MYRVDEGQKKKGRKSKGAETHELPVLAGSRSRLVGICFRGRHGHAMRKNSRGAVVGCLDEMFREELVRLRGRRDRQPAPLSSCIARGAPLSTSEGSEMGPRVVMLSAGPSSFAPPEA